MKTIVDTGPLVAYFCAKDRYHDWSVATLEGRERPLLTCEAVLAETTHRLNYFRQPTDMVFELLRQRAIAIALELETQLEPVALIMAKHADRHIDLADACLVRMSELFPSAEGVTVDAADFHVYRRRDRKVIPYVAPPPR
jgi:predicted nucleic acid-binding protein